MKVGVLALQGDFREHIRALEKRDAETLEVRLPSELSVIDALVIPGGESTTIGKMMRDFGFPGPIREFARKGKPIFGTCAGLIVLADKIDGQRGEHLNLVDIDVRRNAYGRQVDSREVEVSAPVLGPEPFPAVFIRAPRIDKTGPGVEVLALYESRAVLARENNILVCSFHPELTGDGRIHKYFLDMIPGKA